MQKYFTDMEIRKKQKRRAFLKKVPFGARKLLIIFLERFASVKKTKQTPPTPL